MFYANVLSYLFPLVLCIAACSSSPKRPKPEKPKSVATTSPSKKILPVSPSKPDVRTCYDSRFKGKWTHNPEDMSMELFVEEDLDGDGYIDSLRASDSSGSGAGGIWIDAKLTSLSPNIHIQSEYSFRDFLSITAIPKIFHGPRAENARNVIAEVLMETICNQPEASLRLVLEPETLVWQKGEPVVPDKIM